jgi:hypothetical protein
MSVASQFTALCAAPPCRNAWKHRADRFIRDIGRSRPQRVVLLLAAVWIMQYVDLSLTLFAQEHGMLGETNPLARRVLAFGPAGLAAYKFGLMLCASGVLLWCRRRPLTEYLLWAACGLFLALSLYWCVCLSICEDCWGPYTYCRMYMAAQLCQVP